MELQTDVSAGEFLKHLDPWSPGLIRPSTYRAEEALGRAAPGDDTLPFDVLDLREAQWTWPGQRSQWACLTCVTAGPSEFRLGDVRYEKERSGIV